MIEGYGNLVIEHFKNPKNMGEIKNPDAVGELGNPTCGDIMKVFLKVEKNKLGEDIIKDIKFQTMGCVAAIATSSMTTELVKGKTLKEAKKITNMDVARSLGKLPPIKMHCSNMAADALHQAIDNYEAKNK
ncbi:iron-sulfur cluster assembly scaffold protein [Candidatus Pacearchaeota archaeon]|nr:iron-sulfur cluster assembly scaffold protein [Candidatus Pacearchaeota archaeon]